MRPNIVLTILTALTAMVSQAQASNWSMNGSSCVPGDRAIRGNSYTITGGSLTHRGNATDLITLYCPISGTWGSNIPTVLRMTYMDSDTTIAHITAQVIRLTASDGSLSFISPALSNQSVSTNVGVNVGVSFSHQFDFKNSYYYVRVDITRSSTKGFAKLFGVSLDCSTCPAD
jgi:hypothetical protein